MLRKTRRGVLEEQNMVVHTVCHLIEKLEAVNGRSMMEDLDV